MLCKYFNCNEMSYNIIINKNVSSLQKRLKPIKCKYYIKQKLGLYCKLIKTACCN